jgi:hypothetical protein
MAIQTSADVSQHADFNQYDAMLLMRSELFAGIARFIRKSY